MALYTQPMRRTVRIYPARPGAVATSRVVAADPLVPARGIAIGVLMGTALWTGLITAGVQFARALV